MTTNFQKSIRPIARRAARKAVASAVACRQISSSCTDNKKTCRPKTSNRFHHRNQQYSVIALTNGSGAIEERYAYSAYGEPVFTNASGTVLADSAKDNRYTFTGREWDEELNLYHFRARMYDAESGRFLLRDPIGFDGRAYSIYEFVGASPLVLNDPTGKLGILPGGIIVGCVYLAACTVIERNWDSELSATDPTAPQRNCINKVFRIMPSQSKCTMRYKMSTKIPSPITRCHPMCIDEFPGGKKLYLGPGDVNCATCAGAINTMITMMHECVHIKDQGCTETASNCGELEAYSKSIRDLASNRPALCGRMVAEGLCANVAACQAAVTAAINAEGITIAKYAALCRKDKGLPPIR